MATTSGLLPEADAESPLTSEWFVWLRSRHSRRRTRKPAETVQRFICGTAVSASESGPTAKGVQSLSETSFEFTFQLVPCCCAAELSLCSVLGSLLSHCSCRSRRPLDLKVAAGRLPQHLRHHASPGLLRLHADHWVHLHGLSSESGLLLACATAWLWHPPLAFKIAISGQLHFCLAPVRLLPGCGCLALISLLCCVCHGSSAWQEALLRMMLLHFPCCKCPTGS